METHGAPGAALAQRATGLMPKAIAAPTLQRVGIDRMAAFHTAIDAVRRGGTISLSGVYGGQSDPLPMITVFDKQITLCMGQANVHRWVDDILPLLIDGDRCASSSSRPTTSRWTTLPRLRGLPAQTQRNGQSRLPTLTR